MGVGMAAALTGDLVWAQGVWLFDAGPLGIWSSPVVMEDSHVPWPVVRPKPRWPLMPLGMMMNHASVELCNCLWMQISSDFEGSEVAVRKSSS